MVLIVFAFLFSPQNQLNDFVNFICGLSKRKPHCRGLVDFTFKSGYP